MQVTVHYFAVMREQRGLREESVETATRTAGELLQELAGRHSFSLEQSRLRVVVNEEFAEWSRPLREGDAVAFIPPVAGG